MARPPTLNFNKPTTTIKFLCSYGGKILPRHPDGVLRYYGGETRLLAVDRSISFSELLVKLGELCGTSLVSLRCQLPTEDLDALVSITSDEDLANLIEEYDRIPASPPPSALKIRAFLSLPKSTKKISPPPSIPSSSSPKSLFVTAASATAAASAGPRFGTNRCLRQIPVGLPPRYNKSAGKVPQGSLYHGSSGHVYLIHNGNHWL